MRSSRAKKAQKAAKKPPSAPARVELALALGAGRVGLTLGRPVGLGPIVVDEIDVALPGLGFPLDVSGGVAKFRHRRGELRRVRLAATWRALTEWCTVKLRDVVHQGTPRVRLSRARADADGPASRVTIEIAEEPRRSAKNHVHSSTWRAPSVLVFEVAVASHDGDVRLTMTEARGSGLGAPATRLALSAMHALTHGWLAPEGAVFRATDVAAAIASSLFPEAGARAPRAGVMGSAELVLDDEGILLSFSEGRGFVGGASAVRAAESARLSREVDEAATSDARLGDRAALLDALTVAPHHPELARRLVELDALADHAEAALATLREAEKAAPMRMGDVPARLLDRAGDRAGAFARAVRDADREPSAILRATLRELAARLAGDPWTALRELDEATQDARAYGFAHRAALGQAITVGRLDEARAHAGMLEALAETHEEKSACLREIGELYVALGQPTEGIEPLERAVRYTPDDPSSLGGLGLALVHVGKASRGAMLLERAVALSTSSEDRARATLALARCLADPLGDLPAAAARARDVEAGTTASPEARLLEGRVRALASDLEGARLAFARLREEVRTTDHVPLLVAAAAIERDRLGDRAGALRTVRRGLAISPMDPALLELERSLAPRPETAEPARDTPGGLVGLASGPEVAAAPEGAPHAEAEAQEPTLEGLDEAELSERVEVLTALLRADPTRDDVVDELVSALTLLGRGLELLALLSARLEDAPPERREALAVHQRAVLTRLEADARDAGRNEEASLYAMSREALDYR